MDDDREPPEEFAGEGVHGGAGADDAGEEEDFDRLKHVDVREVAGDEREDEGGQPEGKNRGSGGDGSADGGERDRAGDGAEDRVAGEGVGAGREAGGGGVPRHGENRDADAERDDPGDPSQPRPGSIVAGERRACNGGLVAMRRLTGDGCFSDAGGKMRA